MEAFSDSVAVQECAAGGGRGVFAQCAIESGALLLREEALVSMPVDRDEHDDLHFALARAIITHPERERLLAATASLHPTCISVLPDSLLSNLKEQHSRDVACLQSLSEGLAASDQDQRLSADLLRLLLVLRFNAHYSGLYVASEMFNHACNPNCIKLVTGRSANGLAISEVRAVRPIRAGEECCISYLNPPLQSHVRRRAHMERQHFFTPTSCLPLPASSLQQDQQTPPKQQQQQQDQQQVIPQQRAPPQKAQQQQQLPEPSNRFPAEMEAWRDPCGDAEQQATQLEAIETDLDEAESCLQAAEATLASLKARKRSRRKGAQNGSSVNREGVNGSSRSNGGDNGLAETAAAEQTIVKMMGRVEGIVCRAAELLHPRHIVLARAHALQVDACAAALALESQRGQPPQQEQQQQDQQSVEGNEHAAIEKASEQHTTTTVDPVAVAMLQLRAAHELKATQDLHCGSAHYNTAKLLLDMQQALEFLLSTAPKSLYAAGLPQYSNFAKASRADHQLKQQHVRISALYK